MSNEKFKITNITGSPIGALKFFGDRSIPLWVRLTLATIGIMLWTAVVQSFISKAHACTTEWVSMGPGEPFKQVTHCEPLQVNDTPVAQPGRNSMNEFYQGMNQFNKGVQDFGEAYGKGN